MIFTKCNRQPSRITTVTRNLGTDEIKGFWSDLSKKWSVKRGRRSAPLALIVQSLPLLHSSLRDLRTPPPPQGLATPSFKRIRDKFTENPTANVTSSWRNSSVRFRGGIRTVSSLRISHPLWIQFILHFNNQIPWNVYRKC